MADDLLCNPGPRLAPYVDAIVLPAQAAGADGDAAYEVLPSPQPVMGLQLRGQLAVLAGGRVQRVQPLEIAGLSGLQTVARRFVPAAGTRTLLVRFKPYGAAALLGPRLADLVDRQAGFSQLFPIEFARLLAERVAATETDAVAVAIVRRGLEALLAQQRSPLPADVMRAADLIVREHGALRIAALADDLGVGVRRLERGFHACIGVSPKQFAGIARFAWAADRLAGTLPTRLALDAGFADQAHLSRDFARRAAGSPSSRRRGR